MRCGIYVMIRDSKLCMFVPFANKDYRNDWGHAPRLHPDWKSLHDYYVDKAIGYRKENIISDYQ
jgi:hypothetical protein